MAKDKVRESLSYKWKSMVERCYNPFHKSYKDYGGRGITICKKWQDFQNFYLWALSTGFQMGQSLDRINNNGNYKPLNCRFTDMMTQCNNRRSNRWLLHNGKNQTVSQWSRELGINITTLLWRLNKYSIKKSLKKDFEKTPHNARIIEINGVAKSVNDWDNVYGVPKGIIYSRLHRGWEGVSAVTVPLRHREATILKSN